MCAVRYDTGENVFLLSHPQEVFGVSWNPKTHYSIATACADGLVRVWDISSVKESKKPKMLLRGHKERIFNVAWSPLLTDTIASSCDDKTIRVWSEGKG